MFNQISFVFNYLPFKKPPAFSPKTFNVLTEKAGGFYVKCSMFLAKNIRMLTS